MLPPFDPWLSGLAAAEVVSASHASPEEPSKHSTAEVDEALDLWFRAMLKAALRSLARTPSGELISRGVRINTLSPGLVATPVYQKRGLPAEALEAMSRSALANLWAGRLGDPWKSRTLQCSWLPMNRLTPSAASS